MTDTTIHFLHGRKVLVPLEVCVSPVILDLIHSVIYWLMSPSVVIVCIAVTFQDSAPDSAAVCSDYMYLHLLTTYASPSAHYTCISICSQYPQRHHSSPDGVMSAHVATYRSNTAMYWRDCTKCRGKGCAYSRYPYHRYITPQCHGKWSCHIDPRLTLDSQTWMLSWYS